MKNSVVVVMDVTNNNEYCGTFVNREEAEKYVSLLRKHHNVKSSFRIMPQVVCDNAEKLFF